MKTEQRLFYLKIATAGVVGLFLLDHIVITPATSSWREQSARLDALRVNVQRGEQLLDREKSIRAKWADMMKANLPDEVSATENQVFKSLERWALNSGIVFTSLTPTPQWVAHDEGYKTYECRIAGTGNQQTVARFIYELESDRIPVNLENCELTARDAHGDDLAFTARVTFLRMPETGGRTP